MKNTEKGDENDTKLNESNDKTTAIEAENRTKFQLNPPNTSTENHSKTDGTSNQGLTNSNTNSANPASTPNKSPKVTKDDKYYLRSAKKDFNKPLLHFSVISPTPHIELIPEPIFYKSFHNESFFSPGKFSLEAKRILNECDFNILSDLCFKKMSYHNFIQGKLIEDFKRKINAKQSHIEYILNHREDSRSLLEMQEKICGEMKNFSKEELLLIVGFISRLDNNSSRVVASGENCLVSFENIGSVHLKVIMEKIEQIKKERKNGGM